MKKYDKELRSKLANIEQEMFDVNQFSMEMLDDVIELKQFLHDKGYNLGNALYISLTLMQLINGEIDTEMFKSSGSFEDYAGCDQNKIKSIVDNTIVSGKL